MTLVEGNQKAPFSIATTLRCRGRVKLLSLDCSTLPLIRTLYCWMLSKEVSSTIFKIFGMTRSGIELRSPGPLANTLPTRPMSWLKVKLATVVEGDPKVPFSIATTLRCRGGCIGININYFDKIFTRVINQTWNIVSKPFKVNINVISITKTMASNKISFYAKTKRFFVFKIILHLWIDYITFHGEFSPREQIGNIWTYLLKIIKPTLHNFDMLHYHSTTLFFGLPRVYKWFMHNFEMSHYHSKSWASYGTAYVIRYEICQPKNWSTDLLSVFAQMWHKAVWMGAPNETRIHSWKFASLAC